MAMAYYICGAYVVLFIVCLFGAFSKNYSANFMQSTAILLFALWAAWRIGLVWKFGWGYPHEPLVATALLLYSVGSFLKTWNYR